MSVPVNPPHSPRSGETHFWLDDGQISERTHWSHWGWGFQVRRAKPLQFERLINADATGFVLSGSGTAIVTTPPAYQPLHRYIVRVGQRRLSLRTTASGRLPIVVQLGNAVSQVRVRIAS